MVKLSKSFEIERSALCCVAQIAPGHGRGKRQGSPAAGAADGGAGRDAHRGAGRAVGPRRSAPAEARLAGRDATHRRTAGPSSAARRRSTRPRPRAAAGLHQAAGAQAQTQARRQAGPRAGRDGRRRSASTDAQGASPRGCPDCGGAAAALQPHAHADHRGHPRGPPRPSSPSTRSIATTARPARSTSSRSCPTPCPTPAIGPSRRGPDRLAALRPGRDHRPGSRDLRLSSPDAPVGRRAGGHLAAAGRDSGALVRADRPARPGPRPCCTPTRPAGG